VKVKGEVKGEEGDKVKVKGEDEDKPSFTNNFNIVGITEELGSRTFKGNSIRHILVTEDIHKDLEEKVPMLPPLLSQL